MRCCSDRCRIPNLTGWSLSITPGGDFIQRWGLSNPNIFHFPIKGGHSNACRSTLRPRSRAHWPNEDPLGRRFRLLDAPSERAKTVFLTVVGVVADAKNNSLTEAAEKEAYVPMRQRTVAIAGMG